MRGWGVETSGFGTLRCYILLVSSNTHNFFPSTGVRTSISFSAHCFKCFQTHDKKSIGSYTQLESLNNSDMSKKKKKFWNTDARRTIL